MKTSNEKHAAVILKCLPRATADRFLAALDTESCSNIVQLMKDVEVTTEKLQAAIVRLESEGLGRTTSADFERTDGAHGKRDTRHQEKSPFAFLRDIDTPVLGRLFRQEQPRNAAAILSTLPKEFASTILNGLEPSNRVEIIRHIVSLEALSKKEIVELRFSLRLRIQKLLNSPSVSDQTSLTEDSDKDGVSNETRTYESLHQLSQLSNKQIKQLLKRIDTSHLAPALKTLPIQLQRKVLRNMGSKPAAIVSKEIIDVRIDEKHRIERSARSVARAIKELDGKS